MITEGELYLGGKMDNGKWRALTPGEIQAANDYYYPKPPPVEPPPIQSARSNLEATSQGVQTERKPTTKKTNLSKLRINLNKNVGSTALGTGGTGLNIGGLK